MDRAHIRPLTCLHPKDPYRNEDPSAHRFSGSNLGLASSPQPQAAPRESHSNLGLELLCTVNTGSYGVLAMIGSGRRIEAHTWHLDSVL
jgi:hypothetical protein